MASIRQRNGRWQARVTRKGYPPEVQSFNTKTAALRWARSVESGQDRGTHLPTQEAASLLFKDVLERYRLTVTPLKRGASAEDIKLRALQRDRIAGYSMKNLTPEVIADYRDRRLKTVKGSTLIRDIALISGVINHARCEWRVAINNPCQLVRKPSTPPGRSRILSTAELDALMETLRGLRTIWHLPMTQLALETAMRRGE